MQTFAVTSKQFNEWTGNELNRLLLCSTDGSDQYITTYSDMLEAMSPTTKMSTPIEVIDFQYSDGSLNGNNSRLMYFHVDLGYCELTFLD